MLNLDYVCVCRFCGPSCVCACELTGWCVCVLDVGFVFVRLVWNVCCCVLVKIVQLG